MGIANGLRLLFDSLVKKDEVAQYALAERFTSLVCPRYKFGEFGKIYMRDADFLKYYESFEGRNYRSLDRKYELDQFMKASVALEGDTAECGAYAGASSYLMCRRIAGTGKVHHVFDSFEGLSAPCAEDGTHWKPGSLTSGEEVIRRNLKEFDFVKYYKGWIPERFGEVKDRRFCLVHVDVDLYQPTLDTLEFFYERMSPGGVMLCDDYGFSTCPGAKKAMDEFFADKPEEIVSMTTGQGLAIKG